MYARMFLVSGARFVGLYVSVWRDGLVSSAYWCVRRYMPSQCVPSNERPLCALGRRTDFVVGGIRYSKRLALLALFVDVGIQWPSQILLLSEEFMQENTGFLFTSVNQSSSFCAVWIYYLQTGGLEPPRLLSVERSDTMMAGYLDRYVDVSISISILMSSSLRIHVLLTSRPYPCVYGRPRNKGFVGLLLSQRVVLGLY